MITNNVECEVEGIALALRELSKLMLNSRCKKKEAFILSDCQAAIDIVCLQNNKSYRTNTLRGIWRSIKELEDAGVSTKVAWCPGHCGIEGNEIADKKAKEAAELMSFAQEHHSQMKMINNDTAKKIIGEQQMRDWQKAWENTGSGRHTKDMFPSVRVKTRWASQRSIDISYARMLLGSTNLNNVMICLR